MPTFSSKQNLHFFFTLISAFTFLVIAWSTWQVVQQPDLGVLWTDQGIVYYAPPDSLLQSGDIILTIDGVPLQESRFPYYLWSDKDEIEVGISRNGRTLDIITPYIQSAPPPVLLSRLLLIVVVLAFWGISTSVVLFSSSTHQQSIILFFFCQTLGIALALGNITSRPWSGHLSLILTAFAIAMAIHFHLLFPVNRITPANRKWVFLMYAIAALGLSRWLVVLNVFAVKSTFSEIYSSLLNIWALIGLLSVLYLIYKPYRDAPSLIVKRQVGLITLCGALAFTPLLILSISPQILFGQAILPTEFAFVFLIFIPIGYGYAITRYQFIKLDRYTSRSVTALFVISVLSFIYICITAILQTFLPESLLANPLTNVAIVMILVVIYNPLHKRLRHWVDSLLYGGWYDYTSVVGEVTHNLEPNNDIEGLVSTLTGTIQKSMRVHWAYLIWQGQHQDRSVSSTTNHSEMLFDDIHLNHLPAITNYMQKQLYPITNHDLCNALKKHPLTVEEAMLLNNHSVCLWVPIRGFQYSMGLLILGPKFGGDNFDDNDMEILDMVARQASIVFQNAQLINELKAKVHENEQYQKQIIRTREEERKRISRDLHDQVIQTLVGLKYQIAHLQSSLKLAKLYPESNEKAVQLQEEIVTLIQTTRTLCQGLRPAALDLGLIPSIRSLVGGFETQSGIEIQLLVEGDRSIPVSEDVALCLYRCTGEALSNIGKYAGAEEIQIEMSIKQQMVSLAIKDDGKGFQVPERLGTLMAQNHFGLVGMRERVELLHGEFEIYSDPMHGTQLEVSIPLSNNN